MVDSNELVKKFISENDMVLIYFGSKTCSICNAIKPKVEEILNKYPKIKSAQVDVERSLQLSAAYNIFTIPAILVFIEGKEVIREARHISIQAISSKITRYYDLLFQ